MIFSRANVLAHDEASNGCDGTDLLVWLLRSFRTTVLRITASWSVRELLEAILERCGLAFELLVALRTIGFLFGLFWAVLEASWAVPGPPWVVLGSLGPLGAF